jgi:hypothetical protein
MHDPPVKKTKTVVSLPAPYPQSLDSPADVLVEIVNDHPNSAIDDLLPRAYVSPEPSKPWPQNAAYIDPAADAPAYRPDSIVLSSRNRISPSLPASEITNRTRPWLEVSA